MLTDGWASVQLSQVQVQFFLKQLPWKYLVNGFGVNLEGAHIARNHLGAFFKFWKTFATTSRNNGEEISNDVGVVVLSLHLVVSSYEFVLSWGSGVWVCESEKHLPRRFMRTQGSTYVRRMDFQICVHFFGKALMRGQPKWLFTGELQSIMPSWIFPDFSLNILQYPNLCSG